MSSIQRCEQVTRRGRPCRNAALPGSDPPRCARHRHVSGDAGLEGSQPLLPLPAAGEEGGQQPNDRQSRRAQPRRAADNTPEYHQPPLPFPQLSPTEQNALNADSLTTDLRRELVMVRLVMGRLLQLMDDPAQPVAADETRRLASLVFSGARTVAQLQSRQAQRPDNMQEWLQQALAVLADEYAIDL